MDGLPTLRPSVVGYGVISTLRCGDLPNILHTVDVGFEGDTPQFAVVHIFFVRRVGERFIGLEHAVFFEFFVYLG